MFSKIFASIVLLGTLALQVNAHTGISPALGVSGTLVRNDVQRLKASCGTITATTLDTSTPVVAAANGQFTVTAVSFNGGGDGSRQLVGVVDATAVGKTFSGAVTFSQNGNPAPAAAGSEQIVASLPAGTTCTGGAAGNLCLVSFTTSAGFGNCVAVQQGTATAATTAAAAATSAAADTSVATGTAAAGGTTTGATGATGATGGNTHKGHKHRPHPAQAQAAGGRNAAAKNVGGTRAARAVLHGLGWM